MVREKRTFGMRWWEWVFLGLVALFLVRRAPPLADLPRGTGLLGPSFLLLYSVVTSPYFFKQSPLARPSAFPVLLILAWAVIWMPSATWEQYAGILALFAAIGGLGREVLRLGQDQFEKHQLLRYAKEDALRSKLAPHFLFNSLNAMKAQLASDPQAAAVTADRLADLLRRALEGAGRLTVPLREELAFVESYLGIERIRLGDRLRVKLEIPEAAEAMGIPPLSLQVLVENAVKHGIAPREEGGELRIWARTEPWGTREKVWVGVDSPLSEGAQAGPGVGLETLRARLRDPADLVIERADGLFRARFGWIDDREPAPG